MRRWLDRGVQLLGELLISSGALLLLFVAWQLWWTDLTAQRDQDQTIQRLERQFGRPAPGVKVAELSKVQFGEAFAIIRIPRFGRDFARPTLEGTSYAVLERGFGHYRDTVLPGKEGNFAVAGHRTTYGKPLNQIATLRKGDVVIVETRADYFVYAVQRHLIVRPTQTEVLAPDPGHPGSPATVASMTMTSCHPEYSARERYVVIATLQKKYPRAAGLPASYLTLPGKGS